MKTIKLMKLWFMALALLPLSINAQNSTRLSVEDFTISGGETKTMTVDLDNPDMQVTLVQFDLVLPEGLSVQGGEDGIDIARTTYKNHSISYNPDNGRILLASNKNATLSGTSGAIITIDIKAAASFTEGTIKLTNIEIVSPTETVVHPEEVIVVIAPVQTSVSIKADDKSMVYGNAVPTLTYTVTEGTPQGVPALSCEATSQSPVGTYPIKITKGTLTNSDINLTDGTLTITKAPLTITAKSYTIKVGTALPTFEVIYSGFKNNETEEVLTKKPTITCAATNDSAPGEYDIIVSGAEATNYNISYVAGKLTIKDKEVLSIKADDKTMVYGNAVPTLTYTVTEGTPQGEPALSCEATSQSPVGTYTINIANGTLTNDIINLTEGTLTINKAPLTITAKSYEITQGDELPKFEVTYSGFKNSETENVLTKKPTITCAATNDSAPGEYDIIVSDAEATNYNISYVAGKLTIKEPFEVITDDKGSNYIVEDEWNNTVSFAGNTNATNTFEVPSTVTVNGVTYTVNMISENAFSGNTSLTEILLPETITAIGSGAFKNCIHLVSIAIKAITPPTLLNSAASSPRRASSVFEGVNKETCILFVPEGSLNAYKAAEGWNEFKNIMEYNFSAIHAIAIDGQACDIYDLNGRKVRANATTLEGLSKGMYIVNGKKLIVK